MHRAAPWMLLALAACGPGRALVDDRVDSAADASGDADVDAGPQCPAFHLPVPGTCTPTEVVCADDASGTQRCNADGRTFTPVETCASGQLCASGRCIDPCATAATANSYEGCEFFATNTLNSALGHSVAGQSRDEFPFAVVLTNEWPVAATVTVDGGGLVAPVRYVVPPRGAVPIELPWILDLAEGGDPGSITTTRVTFGAAHIRSSLPVAAYQFNPINYIAFHECQGMAGGDNCFSYTNDASLLLPVASLGTQYMVVTRATVRAKRSDQLDWSVSPGFVSVVGVDPGLTTVHVSLVARTVAGGGMPAGNPGDTMTTTLAQGEVLQIVSDDSIACAHAEPDSVRHDVFCTPVDAEDLTGTVITSDAPVSVFAGHDCALVPYNRFQCDHLEEQMLPIPSLGTDYVVARTPPPDDARMDPDLVRVVATRPGTNVTLSFAAGQTAQGMTLVRGASCSGSNCMLPTPGSYLEFEQRGAVLVHTDSPSVVAQFLVGQAYDPNNFAMNGDPDMVLAVPTGQFRSSYTFYTADDFKGTTAILVVPHCAPILLDGHPLPPPVDSVGGYDIVQSPMLYGAHHLEPAVGQQTFGLIVSGLANYCSYTYPGGLDLQPISPPL